MRFSTVAQRFGAICLALAGDAWAQCNCGPATVTKTRSSIKPAWTQTISATVTFFNATLTTPTVTETQTVTFNTSFDELFFTRTSSILTQVTVTNTILASPTPTPIYLNTMGWNPWFNPWVPPPPRSTTCRCPPQTTHTVTLSYIDAGAVQSVLVPVDTTILAKPCSAVSTSTVTDVVEVTANMTLFHIATATVTCGPTLTAPIPTVTKTLTRYPGCVPATHPDHPGFGPSLELFGSAYYSTDNTINPWVEASAPYALGGSIPPKLEQPWLAYANFTAAEASECCNACYATEGCFLSRFNSKTGECVYGSRIRAISPTFNPYPETCPAGMTNQFVFGPPGDWALMRGPCAFPAMRINPGPTESADIYVRALVLRYPGWTMKNLYNKNWIGCVAIEEWLENKKLNPSPFPWEYTPCKPVLQKHERNKYDYVCGGG